MIIAQISDSHLSLDTPARAAYLADCVAHINALPEQPDVVVHSGDIAHNGLREEYGLAHGIMAELKAPYYVIPGNRDKRALLIDTFKDRGLAALRSQFIQYTLGQFDVDIILLDTLSANSNKGTMCERRLAQFAQLLSSTGDKPTCVIMHHPSFDVTSGKDPFQFEDRAVADQFAQILGGATNVVALFCGHVHREFNGCIGTVPASTISAMALDLRRGTYAGDGVSAPLMQIHQFTKGKGFTTTSLAASKRIATAD